MSEKKDLEIVNGDGSNLEISPAYDHLNAGVPHSSHKKPENIVVPKEQHLPKKEEKKKEEEKKQKGAVKKVH